MKEIKEWEIATNKLTTLFLKNTLTIESIVG
jgi:hypothetical protein